MVTNETHTLLHLLVLNIISGAFGFWKLHYEVILSFNWIFDYFLYLEVQSQIMYIELRLGLGQYSTFEASSTRKFLSHLDLSDSSVLPSKSDFSFSHYFNSIIFRVLKRWKHPIFLNIRENFVCVFSANHLMTTYYFVLYYYYAVLICWICLSVLCLFYVSSYFYLY